MSKTQESMEKFSSKDEEIHYWKEHAKQLDIEFNDFRESSSMLEKELEATLTQSDQANRNLRTKCNRLTFDLDSTREKNVQLINENQELHKELTKYRESEQKMLNYVRELEQKNDDVERYQRAVLATVDSIQQQLDTQIEKNALLETELSEKDELKTMVQRLKDEQRDLQQELQRQIRVQFSENERVASPISSHKLASFSMEPQTLPATPVKTSVSMGQLSPRISALNLVGDLLKKVGSLETNFAASKTARSASDLLNRDSYRTRNQRLNRQPSSPTTQHFLKQ